MGGNPACHYAIRPIRRVSIVEQTAAHLREGIRTGRWRGELPGVLRLATECDVSKDAIRDALRLLEAEGLVGLGHAGAHRAVLGTGDGGRSGPCAWRSFQTNRWQRTAV